MLGAVVRDDTALLRVILHFIREGGNCPPLFPIPYFYISPFPSHTGHMCGAVQVAIGGGQ
jgi:hypothetical protein